MDHAGLRVQYLSDTHLEFPFALQNMDSLFERQYSFSLETLPVLSDCLCLIGDIGSPFKPSYKEFIELMSNRFPLVIVVPGNHEFYSTRQTPCTYASALKAMKEICDRVPKKNVLFGHKMSLKHNGIRILATTLWSHVPPEHAEEVANGLTDYRVIRVERGEEAGPTSTAKVEDTNQWHKDELEWITDEIEKAKQEGERVLVMTHHAPTKRRTSAPKHTGGGMQSGFATDLEHLLCPPVAGWLFGHTHYNDPYFHKGDDYKVLVASNQLGYFAKGDRADGFHPNNVVFVPSDPQKPTQLERQK